MSYMEPDALGVTLALWPIGREPRTCRGLPHGYRNLLFDRSNPALAQPARRTAPCRAGRKAKPLKPKPLKA